MYTMSLDSLEIGGNALISTVYCIGHFNNNIRKQEVSNLDER